MQAPLLLYNLFFHAAMALGAPLALASKKRRLTLGQRLGLPPSPRCSGTGRPLWIHALSVGEVLSAVPLVAALRRRQPERTLVFSTSTFTGQQIAEQRIAGWVDDLCYFPFDLPMTVGARMRQIRPAGIVLVETDLWPNFLRSAAAAAIPVALVNARLSRRSFFGYRRARAIVSPMLRSLSAVAVQSPADACRFRRLGVEPGKLTVAGNLKYDQPLPLDPAEEAAAMRAQLQIGADQPVLVAGSTHPGDEEALVSACSQWRSRFADLVCVAAPRDPERAGELIRTFSRQGLNACRWSELMADGRRHVPVVVVDKMGILARLYAAADLAFVGGSLAGCGGHNPLEAAAFARPVLYGPDMSDFSLVAEQLEAAGGAVRVDDGDALAQEGLRLLADRQLAELIGARARGVFEAHRGAVARTVDLIDSIMPPFGCEGA